MAQRTLGIVNAHAAGIDVGSETIFVAAGEDTVKQFRTDTGSYHAAISYLRQQGVRTVAMEATGVYWIALYELLEEAGIEVYVVNSAYVKHLPGHKPESCSPRRRDALEAGPGLSWVHSFFRWKHHWLGVGFCFYVRSRLGAYLLIQQILKARLSRMTAHV